MLSRRYFLGASAAVALPLPIASVAATSAFPSRPMRLVVPYTAGGTGDIQSRLIGEHMAKTLGQSVTVENKPGGGTIIGASQVANAPADGYTLLLIANSFVINAKVRGASLPYAGIKAFEPVAGLTNSPQVIAVNANKPWKTLKDWLAAAKANPGAQSYCSVGPTTTQHIAAEMLVRQAGIKGIYVPYPGGTAAVNAVLAGHADMVLQNLNELQSFIDAGRLRALAVTSPNRLESHPAIPTAAEAGLPGYEASAWFGLMAPAGTPKEAVARISDAALAALADPEVRKKLVSLGLEPYAMDTAKFSNHIDEQYRKYAKVIDDAGIKATA